MKRNNIILAAILLAVFILGLVGVALANPQTIEETKEDRLVGVFVTTEYLDLFDFNSYLNNNTNNIVNGRKMKDDGSYNGRLYATLEDQVITNEETGETLTRQKYVFSDIDGFEYFTAEMQNNGQTYTATYGDDVFSDGNTHISVTDFGNSIEIEGTVYVLPKRDDNVFYMNPVYQTDSGDIYATQGTGLSGNMDSEGSVMSQTLDASYTVTKDGNSQTDSASIKVSISGMYEPVGIEIIEFDENSEIVARNEYAPGDVPKNIELMTKTEYIVVTTRKSDPQGGFSFSAETYNKSDTSINTFYSLDDGICRGQYTTLTWD